MNESSKAPSDEAPPSPALALFRPQTVRERAQGFLARAEAGGLAHVTVDLSRLDRAVSLVLETIRRRHPDLQIPPHGVWRAFEAGGIDRWDAMAGARGFLSAEDILLAAGDLALLAVMMTTSRPEGRVYEDRMTGTEASGAEASALAAFHMFASGAFSSDMSDPYRVDASTLAGLGIAELASGLQWHPHDDEAHLLAMQRHLKRFGEALALRPDLFGEIEDGHGDGATIRPGLLVVRAARDGDDGAVSAELLLDRLLEALAPVFEGGASSGEICFGDCFRHTAWPEGVAGGADELASLMPFHLAAQEMVFSLLEPFAWAGIELSGTERLTGPSDPAHAALYLAEGIASLREADDALAPEDLRDRMIELRAVTIALTDLLAERLASELGVGAGDVPLTCLLEGGSSRAGQAILGARPELAQNLGKILNPGAVIWLPFGA